MDFQKKYIKYKHKYSMLKGGVRSNCTSRLKLIEKDCIDNEIIRSIYDKNIIYQRSLSELDRYIIWFYTYDSSFVNNYLREKRNKIIEIKQVLFFFIFIDFYNLKVELLEEFKKTDPELQILYNVLFYYNNPEHMDFEKLIECINSNTLTPEQKDYLKQILDIKDSKINYSHLITRFIIFYYSRLNTIILNSPKLDNDILLYKVINLPMNYFDDISNMKPTFHSCSCSVNANFFEYVNNPKDTESYTFMKIICMKGFPILFTDRTTSFFGDHSYEVILPYNVSFSTVNKCTITLCGYEYDFDHSDNNSNKIISYIEKANTMIDSTCEYTTNCRISTEIIKQLIVNKPNLHINNLVQISRVIRKSKSISETVNCIKVVAMR